MIWYEVIRVLKMCLYIAILLWGIVFFKEIVKNVYKDLCVRILFCLGFLVCNKYRWIYLGVGNFWM